MSTELLKAELLEAVAESTVSTGWPASSAMEGACLFLWVIKPRSNAPQPGYSISCAQVERQSKE